MQTLRKKNSPCKFKKEPTRFLGEGVSFKAKLIGILEVSEARGDRMCQAALADLKMAIRAAGEHKQRIAVQVSIDGLRLRDEKTGECLYHHPVHKISFIAQDMSDSRAFGYIFGSPDTGHRFFGIKTDKAANQVVIAMRDLFQVVFELKKKEIELTKQNIEQNANKFHLSGIFVELAPDTKGAAGTESCLQRMRRASLDVDKVSSSGNTNEKKNDGQTEKIANLLDLQFDLHLLQEGIDQMDKITPDNPRPSSEDPFVTDTFEDSFANIKVTTSVQPILPPPPSTSKRGHLDRQQTIPATPSSATSSPAAQPLSSGKSPPHQESIQWLDNESEKRFSDGEIASLTNTGSADEEKENGSTGTGPNQRKSPQIDVFTELDPLGTGLSKPYIDKKDFFQHLKNPPKKVLKDLVTTNSEDTFPTNFDISLDSLDPIKVKNDADQKSSRMFEDGDFADFEIFENDNDTSGKEVSESAPTSLPPPTAILTAKGESPQPLANRSNQRIVHQPLSVSLPPEDSPVHQKSFSLNNTAPINPSSSPRMEKESSDSMQSLRRQTCLRKYRSIGNRELDPELSGLSRLRESIDKPFPVDFSNTNESPGSPLRSCSSDANSRLSSSSAELDIVPEPPPRGAGSILINPPPLPPKKQGVRGGNKPPPRPPHTDSHLHYDFIEREDTSPSPTKRERTKSPGRVDEIKHRFDDNFSPPSPLTLGQSEIGSGSGGISSSRFDTMTPTTLSTLFRNPYLSNVSAESKKATTTTNSSITTRPSLDITLSQLTSSNLAEFASSLDMSVAELTSLTLQQLTECLARLPAREPTESSPSQRRTISPASRTGSGGFPKTPPTSATQLVETSFVSSEPLFKADFDPQSKSLSQQSEEQPVYDKYAVFRELLESEQRREDNIATENHDLHDPMTREESPNDEDEYRSTLNTDPTAETTDNIVRMTNLLATCDLSVQLPPLEDELPDKETRLDVKSKDRTNGTDGYGREDNPDVLKSSKEYMKTGFANVNEDLGPINACKDGRENINPSENHDTRVSSFEKKTSKPKLTNEDSEATNEQGDRDEELDEEEEEEDDEDEDEEEEEEEAGVANGEAVAKKLANTKLAMLMAETKDRYAALREIVEDTEPTIVPKEISMDEEKPMSTPVTSPIQQQVPKTLAEQDLLKLFSEPSPEIKSPRKPASSNEEDLRAVTADIFEEIRMLNSAGDQCTMTCRLSTCSTGQPTSAGFEDVFCPFTEPKLEPNKDGRESTESVKDEGNWAKFESSVVFHSDKSSCEGPGSVGGTSPWSPDEKDFQTETGGTGVKVTVKHQQPQQRLHSGESDNEWKDDEESEESNGKRQLRDESGFWCRRQPRFEIPEDGRPYYEDPSERGDKERHFRERERGSRKPRGAPWPKQASAHRTRDSSPWHEEPTSRGWPREEDDPHQGLPRGRYLPTRTQMPAAYKEELDDPSKSYWKCRTKPRAWNGDRESFRNPTQQQPSQPGLQQPPHFVTEPMFYEEDRTKRRMMLWSEDDRDRDRFSSQESMAYEDEERWSRREYDRRRERWDDEGGSETRFWPRRTPADVDSRVDPRLDPRNEYGPPPSHDMYRKQHYCRGDTRELRDRSAGHDLYVPGPMGVTGCWPEDDYSLPMPDRPDNSPRYLTRKRHWPKRPNSANDERNLSEPVYADPRFKYGMSRSECSDNDSELYHRPYRSRSRESYWGSDQEFESWTGGGSGSERLYWSEGPDAKSETLHRRRMNRHKANRPGPQKSQSSPFEDDFTETIDRNEPAFDSPAAETSHGIIMDMDGKQSTTPRNVKEHLRNDQRCGRYAKPPGTMNFNRGSGYFESETIMNEPPSNRARKSAELKSTPEDFPTDVDKTLTAEDPPAPDDNENRDSFYNGDPSPGFDDDAFAFKSEMADSVPETTAGPTASLKNSRQIKYGNNKMKNEHDIKKSESVNIFVRESDPFDDDDFFK